MSSKSSFLVAAVGCMAVVISLGSAFSGCAGKAPPESGKADIPEISRIAGVRIGYSTQEDLARRWGEGMVVTGGHPNSGRVWRVKGTSWVVRTDGFEYSQRGLVVDGLELLNESPHDRRAPFARLTKDDFAWLGGVTPGLSRSEVEMFLKNKSLVSTNTDYELTVPAKGHYALVNSTLGNWTVRFDFTTNRLSRLVIDASN